METKLIRALFEKHTISNSNGKSIVIDGATVRPPKVKDYFTIELAKRSLSKDEGLLHYRTSKAEP